MDRIQNGVYILVQVSEKISTQLGECHCWLTSWVHEGSFSQRSTVNFGWFVVFESIKIFRLKIWSEISNLSGSLYSHLSLSDSQLSL